MLLLSNIPTWHARGAAACLPAAAVARRPRPRQLCRAGTSGAGDSADGHKSEDLIWAQLAFPFYLQNSDHKPGVCQEFETAIREAEGGRSSGSSSSVRDDSVPCVWQAIRAEAERDAAEEPLLSSFLYASILAHDSFERALAFVLSNRLASAVMLPTQLFEIFHEVLTKDVEVREGALADVEACRERDPACRSYSQALLYYKGYHALQTHRIAHALWTRGQRVMAMALQSRVSEVLAVDIHPAARLGRGILLDHGTGVVIGETAVIGNNVSMLQNVTLGGTGKETGDRHPKISDNVLIGASATVLGNIVVGRGAQIAAGSLVLKPVPPHTMVAGSPAKPVGKLFGNPALDMQQWCRKFNDYDPLADKRPERTGGDGEAATTADVVASSSSDNSSSNGISLSTLNGNGRASHLGAETSSGWAVANTNGASNGAASNGKHSNAHAKAQHHTVTLHTHEQSHDQWAGPAPLRGVYEGDVDATMDEEAAAVLWPSREDPEYVI